MRTKKKKIYIVRYRNKVVSIIHELKIRLVCLKQESYISVQHSLKKHDRSVLF
jgi:hypothetical protein